MTEPVGHLDAVGNVVEALAELGLEPVLVGGMALVVLGSRRVTRDFDFLVARPGEALGPLLDVFYDRGFELASRVSAEGEVTATIDNRRVAAARLRLDAPASAHFLDPRTGLRVDLLLDFPLPAAALSRRATTFMVRSRVWRVASAADLLRLKRVAQASRSSPLRRAGSPLGLKARGKVPSVAGEGGGVLNRLGRVRSGLTKVFVVPVVVSATVVVRPSIVPAEVNTQYLPFTPQPLRTFTSISGLSAAKDQRRPPRLTAPA